MLDTTETSNNDPNRFIWYGVFVIITVVSASSSISETFIIEDVVDLTLGEYEITVNRPLTQNYYEDVDTFSIMKITGNFQTEATLSAS